MYLNASHFLLAQWLLLNTFFKRFENITSYSQSFRSKLFPFFHFSNFDFFNHPVWFFRFMVNVTKSFSLKKYFLFNFATVFAPSLIVNLFFLLSVAKLIVLIFLICFKNNQQLSTVVYVCN